MIKKITLLVNYNLYESKLYFADKMAEALQRHGIQAKIIDVRNIKNGVYGSDLKDSIENVDLTCSFHDVYPFDSGKYFWEYTHVPHWSILVDPSYYARKLFFLPNSILSCVDHYDCQYALSEGVERVFFWPHAVERELSYERGKARPYDVVFIGSCYDHEFLKASWRKEYPPLICKIIEEAVEKVLGDNCTPLLSAVLSTIESNGLTPLEVELDKIVRSVDNYMRGKDRFELICGIKDVQVHVFGGLCWRREQPVHTWSYNLCSRANITVHPPISFKESLEVLRKSKICLNSMPFFKNGSHERIFTGLACGALPITTDNVWVRDNFIDGEELLLYRSNHWDEVNDLVNKTINDEAYRRKIVAQGREKVLLQHTWDVRVEQMLDHFNQNIVFPAGGPL